MGNDMRDMINLINSLEQGIDVQNNGYSGSVLTQEDHKQKTMILEGILDALLGDIDGVTYSIFKNIIDISLPDAKTINESTKVNKYSVVESKVLYLEDIIESMDHHFDKHDTLSKTIAVDYDKFQLSDATINGMFEALRTEKWVGRVGNKYTTIDSLKEALVDNTTIEVGSVYGVNKSEKWSPINFTFTPIVVEDSNGQLWSLHGSNEIAQLSSKGIKTFTGKII